MIDTRMFFCTIPAENIGHQKFWGPAAFHDAGFLAQQGEGWTPVDHVILPTADGSVLVSIMCTREITVDTVAADELSVDSGH